MVRHGHYDFHPAIFTAENSLRHHTIRALGKGGEDHHSAIAAARYGEPFQYGVDGLFNPLRQHVRVAQNAMTSHGDA